MAHIKTIAIVGATGKIGSTIARTLYGKYRLLLMSTDESTLLDLKTELDKSRSGAEAFAVSCAREAAWEADIIILATPCQTDKEVAEKIREVAIGKIVISIANSINSSYRQLLTSEDSSAAEELQKLLPYSKVVKTFNTTFADGFMKPLIDGRRFDAFIAGNNSDAVQTVSEVVADAGLNPVVVGDLTISRRLERMQLTMIHLALENNYPRLSGWRNTHHSHKIA